MSEKYTEAQHRATNKWRQSKSQITLAIDKEMGDRWRAEAEAEGVSLTKWIVEKVESAPKPKPKNVSRTLANARADYRVMEINNVCGEDFNDESTKYEVWLNDGYIFDDGSGYNTASTVKEIWKLLDGVEEGED